MLSIRPVLGDIEQGNEVATYLWRRSSARYGTRCNRTAQTAHNLGLMALGDTSASVVYFFAFFTPALCVTVLYRREKRARKGISRAMSPIQNAWQAVVKLATASSAEEKRILGTSAKVATSQNGIAKALQEQPKVEGQKGWRAEGKQPSRVLLPARRVGCGKK